MHQNFCLASKAGPRCQGERAAHRLHPLSMRSFQGAQVLGGEWAAILPKAELVWDLRLSLEMVSSLHPTILLHLVFCGEILICSPPPFPTAQFNKSSFVSQCILETWEIALAEDRQTGGFALPKTLCTFLCRPESLEVNSWSPHAWGSGIFRGVTEVTVG